MRSDRISVAIVSEPGTAGVKTHVIDLLTGIDLTRFEITYYYSLWRSDQTYRGEIARLRDRGIDCIELPMDVRLGVFKDLRALCQLIRNLRRKQPAVLHLHSSKAGGLGRLAKFFVYPMPTVLYTPHAMACYRSRFYLWLERTLGHLTSILIAVSASEKRDFVRWRIPRAEQAETIPLGVRVIESIKTVSKSSHDIGRWTVGGCGRICYQKNALLFFQVALETLRTEKDYHFKWIGDFGDDAEAQAVRAMLSSAGDPPQIEITGWVERPQVELENLDVFCMLSRYESFGYVTAEAMLLGVPVVATRATGTIDLVRHEETGLLTEPDPIAIIAAIRRLRMDDSLRLRLISASRRLIGENYTVDKMVVALERLYSQSLQNV